MITLLHSYAPDLSLRHRIGVLMRVTCIVARKGCCSAPALAVLQSVLADVRRTPRDVIFQLERDSVNELFALCALAPLLQTDWRVDYPNLLFCMDASPTGAGLCAAALPRDVVKELWRYSEQKGFYTKLLEPASAILAAAGLDEDPGVGLVEDLGDANVAGLSFGSEPLPLKRPLSTTGGFLHLFLPGSTWDQAHEAAGLAAVPLTDPRLPNELHFTALSSDAVFHGLRDLITSGAVFDLHVSAPALSFLPRGRFKARSEADPSAACRDSGDLALHNQLARRLCFLLCIAASCGVYFSVAQP
ncbi:unnamed protein product, partial [Symbiodinium necroappetens]